jgi:hypothetical protein
MMMEVIGTVSDAPSEGKPMLGMLTYVGFFRI